MCRLPVARARATLLHFEECYLPIDLLVPTTSPKVPRKIRFQEIAKSLTSGLKDSKPASLIGNGPESAPRNFSHLVLPGLRARRRCLTRLPSAFRAQSCTNPSRPSNAQTPHNPNRLLLLGQNWLLPKIIRLANCQKPFKYLQIQVLSAFICVHLWPSRFCLASSQVFRSAKPRAAHPILCIRGASGQKPNPGKLRNPSLRSTRPEASCRPGVRLFRRTAAGDFVFSASLVSPFACIRVHSRPNVFLDPCTVMHKDSIAAPSESPRMTRITPTKFCHLSKIDFESQKPAPLLTLVHPRTSPKAKPCHPLPRTRAITDLNSKVGEVRP